MTALENKKVLVTREKRQAEVLAQKIEAYGGEPLIADVLKITCTAKARLEAMQTGNLSYEWVVFTSANGVDCFFQGLDERAVTSSGLKFAVVGHKTNEALKRHGIDAAFTPSIYNAETMGKEFLEAYPNPGKVLLVRGSKSRPELANRLSESGIDFESLEVYRTETNQSASEKMHTIFAETTPDYITFMSPSAVDAFCELQSEQLNEDTVIVCIGTTTEKHAFERGFRNLLVPETFTMEAMLQVMCEHAEKGG